MKIEMKMPDGFTPTTVVAIFSFAIFVIILISVGGEGLPISNGSGKYLLWGTGGYIHHSATKHYFEIKFGLFLYLWIHFLFSMALFAASIGKGLLSKAIAKRRKLNERNGQRA